MSSIPKGTPKKNPSLNTLVSGYTQQLEDLRQEVKELKTIVVKDTPSKTRICGTQILASLLMAICFVCIAGIILLSLCLSGYLGSLAMAIGSTPTIIMALVACAVISVICIASVICLSVNGYTENKSATSIKTR